MRAHGSLRSPLTEDGVIGKEQVNKLLSGPAEHERHNGAFSRVVAVFCGDVHDAVVVAHNFIFSRPARGGQPSSGECEMTCS